MSGRRALASAAVQIQLPDGTLVEHPAEATPLDVARGISEGLARSVVAAEIDGLIVDAVRPLGDLAEGDQPLPLKLLTSRDEEALGVLRHSAAHVMARAVMRLYDGVSLAFGPTTEGGFYYDFYFYLWNKVDNIFSSTVNFLVSFLTAIALHL